MKVVTIENDPKLENTSERYLSNFPGYTPILDAHNVDTDRVLDAFKTHDVLVFKPTQITYSQYNLMVMAMYKLMKAGELGIKEIRIIAYDAERIEEELRDLWGEKRMYLDQVLEVVKIYQVYPGDEPKEIRI